MVIKYKPLEPGILAIELKKAQERALERARKDIANEKKIDTGASWYDDKEDARLRKERLDAAVESHELNRWEE